MKIKINILTVIVFMTVLTLTSSKAFSQASTIQHTPVNFAERFQTVEVVAKLSGDPSGATVTEATLWYRDPLVDSWSSIKMDHTPEGHKAEILNSATGGEQVDYYIEMKFESVDGEQTVTYPFVDPREVPLTIALESPDPTEQMLNAKGMTGLSIISPTAKTVFTDGELLLMIYIDPTKRALRKKDLSVTIDGKEYINETEITEEFLTLFVTGLEAGEHKISIVNKRLQDAVMRTTVTTTEPTEEAKAAMPKPTPIKKSGPAFSGSIGTMMTYQDLNGSLHRTAIENLHVRGSAGSWGYQMRGQFSSEESNSVQPQHRYSIEFNKGGKNIRLLDVYPRYNELILWGKRTRGAELDFRGEGASFSIVYGDLLREVEGDQTSLNGTYRRWMGAMRFSFGDPRKLNVGFTVMKAKDDDESIDYGIKPKDNFVSGLDLSMTMFDRKVTLRSDMAFSMFNQDISAPGFEKTESINDIIWINQYFTPTPEDTSTSESDIFSGVLKNTLSHKTSLGIRTYGNNISIGYYSYAKSFRSLGLPSLSTDRAGFFIRDFVTVMDGRVNLSGGLTTMSDNLSGKNPITNDNLNWDFMVGVNTPASIPNLNFTMNSNSITNDVDSVFAQSKMDNRVGSFGLNLSEEYTILDMRNRFSFGISSSSGEDTYDSLNTSDQSMWNFSVVNRNDMLPMTTTLSYSASTTESYAGATNLDFSNFALTFKFNLLGGKLKPYFSPRFVSKSGDNSVSPLSPSDNYLRLGKDLSDPTVAAEVDSLTLTSVKDIVVDQSQTYLNAGVEYEFLPRHNLRVDMRMTSYSESNKNRYWNGAEFNREDQTITNTDGVNTITFNQADAGSRNNDLIMLVGYNYRF